VLDHMIGLVLGHQLHERVAQRNKLASDSLVLPDDALDEMPVRPPRLAVIARPDRYPAIARVRRTALTH
jgi:hypothetical protein